MAQPGEVILVTWQDKPVFFARVESVTPDVKKGWYQIKLLILQIPLATVTWIVQGEHIGGQPFTMGGETVCLHPVVAPEEPLHGPKEPETPKKSPGSSKVIAFTKKK